MQSIEFFSMTTTAPNHPIFDICIAFRIFIMLGVRNFKFGRLTDQTKS